MKVHQQSLICLMKFSFPIFYNSAKKNFSLLIWAVCAILAYLESKCLFRIGHNPIIWNYTDKANKPTWVNLVWWKSPWKSIFIKIWSFKPKFFEMVQANPYAYVPYKLKSCFQVGINMYWNHTWEKRGSKWELISESID